MDFNELDLSLIEPSADIQHTVSEIASAFNEAKAFVVHEGLALGTVAAAGAIYLFGFKNVMHFLMAVIDKLIQLIKFVLSKIKAIFAYIKNRLFKSGSDASSFVDSNSSKLNAARDSNVLVHKEAANINLNGYKMDLGLVKSIAATIESEATLSYDHLLMTLVDKNTNIFTDHSEVIQLLAANRARMLAQTGVANAALTYADFQELLKTTLYGTKGDYMYTLGDAMHIIDSFPALNAEITSLANRINNQCKIDIANLERMRADLKKRQNLYTDTRANLPEQISWLLEYRNVSMNDYTMAFEIICKYLADINAQSKAICMRVLQISGKAA